MSECSAMRESMPLLLTESLDPARRELTHQHIESCDLCGLEWSAYKETWNVMSDLPEVEVPARVKAQFLAQIGGLHEKPASNVVTFRRRPALKWIAQAAAVAVLVGGGYFAGRGNAPVPDRTPAVITDVTPAARNISRV